MLENEKEKLRTLTVEVLLAIRAEYLRTPGVNVLKHWDQLQDRMRAASRTTSTPEEWITSIQRALKLGSPSPSMSEASLGLANAVHEQRCSTAWLQLVEDEWGFLMAMSRAISEQRKRTKENTHA